MSTALAPAPEAAPHTPLERDRPGVTGGFYEALSWLTGSLDGWPHARRRAPAELPVRGADGTVADDARSRELAELIEDTRRRAQRNLRQGRQPQRT